MTILPAPSGALHGIPLGSYGHQVQEGTNTISTGTPATFQCNAVDRFTNTPITDSYVRKIQSARTPPCEKVTLALASPVVIPFTAIIDVVLWPVVKCSQAKNWLASKFQ